MKKIKNKAKRIIPNLILLLATIFIFIIFLEIGLRMFYPQNLNPTFIPTSDKGTFAEYDELLGWKLKLNAEGHFFTSEFNTYIKNNAQGMRMGKNISLKKSKYRIAFLGDSFIWGYGVGEPQRISEDLENELGNVEVLNFGVTGYGTDQYYLQLNKSILQFVPNMVIIGFYANDLEDAGNNIRYDYPKPLFKITNNNSLQLTNVPVPKKEKWYERKYSALTKINLFLSQKSHTFVFFKPLLRNLIDIAAGHKYAPDLWDFSIIKKDYSKEYKQYKQLNDKLYCEMSDMLRKRHVIFVVMNIPPKSYLIPELFKNGLRQYNIREDEIDINKTSEMLYKLSLDCGFYFIDLYPYFRDYKEREKLYFKIDGHWNPAGHKYASEILSKKLREEKLIH